MALAVVQGQSTALVTAASSGIRDVYADGLARRSRDLLKITCNLDRLNASHSWEASEGKCKS